MERKPRLSWAETLEVIGDFGTHVAQAVTGGHITTTGNPNGDIYHEDSKTFMEVKAAGLSCGAIVWEEQLRRHLTSIGDYERRYVIVYYANRLWQNGRWQSMPRHISTSKRRLRDYLYGHVREVYVVDISIILTLFDTLPLKRYNMQRGMKSYIRLPCCKLRRLAEEPEGFAEIGLDAKHYKTEGSRRFVQAQGRKASVRVWHLTANGVTEP